MRYSKQRNLILDILRANRVHPTAEWIYEQARVIMPSIGLATVYRNLKQLVEAGEIERITGADGVERFDGDMHRHYHLKCRRCGRLYDLQGKNPQAAERIEAMVKELFAVEASDVCVSTALLEGVCTDCSAE